MKTNRQADRVFKVHFFTIMLKKGVLVSLYFLLIMLILTVPSKAIISTTFATNINSSETPSDYFLCGGVFNTNSSKICNPFTNNSIWTTGVNGGGTVSASDYEVNITAPPGGGGFLISGGLANRIQPGWACDWQEITYGAFNAQSLVGADSNPTFNDGNNPMVGRVDGQNGNKHLLYRAADTFASTSFKNPTNEWYNMTIFFNSTSSHSVAFNNSDAIYTENTAGSFAFPMNFTFYHRDSISSVKMGIRNVMCYNLTTGAPQRQEVLITPNISFSFNITSPRINDIINFTGNLTSDVGLAFANITYNMSGILTIVNFSLSGTSAQISNATKITTGRGSVINFTMYATDNNGGSSQQSQLITVANTPPSCSPGTLNNTAPGTNDVINQTGCTYSDADSDAQQTSQYLWYKNNVLLAAETGVTFNLATSGNGDKGDTLNASERTYDGFDYGSYANVSAFAVVQNTPPPAPLISAPASGIITKIQPLPINIVGPADADSDTVTILYYINGRLNQTSSTNTTLNASDGAYILNVSLFDGVNYGSNATVNFTIDTTGPVFSPTSLNNSNPKRNEVAQIGVRATDASNVSTIIFSWNGTSNGAWVNVSNSTALNSPALNYTVNLTVTLPQGKVIGYQFFANDTLNTFGSTPAQAFTVANTIPQVPTIISPAVNLYTSSQPLNLQVTFPADVDNDALTISYYINDRLNQTSLTNTTLNASDGAYILNVSLSDGASTGSNATVNFTIDTTGPIFSASSLNNSNPKRNEVAQIGVKANDLFTDISTIIFSWNGTSNGAWVNASNYSASNSPELNYTVNMTIALPQGKVIGYQFFANDSLNTFNSNAVQTFAVANTIPLNPVIISPTANLYTNSQPLNLQVTFPADVDNDPLIISYYINGRLNQTSSTNTTLNASDGAYILNVSLFDGVNYGSNATVNFTIDTTGPVFSPTSLNNSNPKRNEVAQIGVKANDLFTDVSTIIFSWNGTSNGAWVNVSNSTALNSPALNYTVNLTVTLPQGKVIGYQFFANDTLNTFGSTPAQAFTVANTIPQVPTIISPAVNLYTSSQPLNLRVTFPADADNDVLNISYYINGVLNQTSLTNATLNASDGYYILNASLNDGIFSGANASVNFTIDTIPPSISELNSNDTDNVTRNNAILNFTVTALDINLFNVSLNGTLMNPIGSNVFRLASNASDLGCANEGNCLLAARALDLAGNTNNFSYNMIIDNTVPALADFRAKNDTDNITRSDNVLNFTLTASDANGFSLAVLNGTSMSSGTGEFYLATTPAGLNCANGQCLLSAAVTDKANNQNTIAYVITVDNLNPNIALNAPQNMANVSGILNITVSVTDLIANISSLTALQTLNGSTPVSKAYAMSLFSGTEGNGLWNLTFDSRTLRSGLASFRFNATDKAGNYNDTLEVNITIDNMRPKVLSFNGIAVNNANLSNNATINVTAVDNMTGIKFLVFNLSSPANAVLNAIKDGNNFAALLETKNFTDGFYNITAVPEDFAGNREIAHVVISEVLYESAGGANSNEWIELYNPTPYPVNITNWVIDVKSASSDATIANESIINPKSAFIIADNSTLFFNLYGFYPDLDQQNLSREFKFIGTNDFIRLKDSTGAVIDEVSWGNNVDASYNWSLFADEGRTIARNPASGDVNEQYDWQSNATATPKILTNPNHITIKIDNTPPQINSFNGNVVNGALLKGAITINATIVDALSQVNAVIFAVSGSGSVQLNLSTSREQNFWNASLDTAKLADGKYNISVFANDSLNNINNTEFIEVTIDNNPPAISNLIPPNSSFANFTSTLVSFVLKDNTTGVNISSSAVQLNYTLDAIGPITAALNAPAAVAGGYNFSATINTFNAERINLSVSAKDNNSNVMPTAKWSFTVDLAKPVVNNIQINDTDRILRSIDVVNVTLNSTNSLAGIKNVTIGSSSILGMSNIYSTTWQIVLPASAFGCSSDGSCTLNIVSEDNAGNINNSESIILTIDNTNPQANNIMVNNTIVSNITPIRINLTINDANFAIGAVTASNASTVSLSNATTAPYWAAETTASALGCPLNGNCRITFKAVDSAGNINNTEGMAVSVDSSPPSISNVAINDSNNIVKDADVLNMSLTATDSNTIAFIRVNNFNFSRVGSVWSVINQSYGFCSSEGLCTVAFAVSDNLSNSNSSQTFAFTIDNTAPALSDIKLNITNNISRQESIVNFSITAADANNISTLFLNSTPLVRLNNTVWSTVNKTSSLCGANDGDCSLEFRATDNAGNAQTSSLKLLVDSSNPQFSNPASSPATKYNTLNITLNTTWSDSSGIASVTFSHNATGSFQSYNGILSESYYITTINSSSLRNQQVIGWNSSAYDVAGNLNDSMVLQTFKIENRAPALASIPNITIAEDSNSTINLASYFTDADSDNLTYFVAAQPENITVVLNSTSGAVALSPKSNLFGERYAVFNASDGLAHTLSNNVTINITNVNDNPVLSTVPNVAFNEDSYNDSLNLDDFVADADNSDSQIAWSVGFVQNSNVQINISNSRIANITASGNFSGSSTAFLTASDGSSSINTNVFTITVNQVNDAPTMPELASPANNSVFSATNITLSWQASKDNESSAIAYYVFNSNGTIPALNATTSSTSYKIENLSVGRAYYWAVLASDGSLNSTLSGIRQYNTTANLAPNITAFYPNTTALTMQEGQPQKFNITKADAEGNIINVTWFIDGALDNGSVGSDNLTYNPNLISAGLHNITAIVKDLFDAQSRVEWIVTVANTNQAPTLIAPTALLNATEEALFTFNITASDPDNDALTFASNRSDVLITKFNYTAVINWTPLNSDIGITVIKFNATDTGNLSASGTVSINVSNVNDAPSIASFFPASDNPIIAEENGTQVFNVTAADADNDALAITWKLNGIANKTGNSYTAVNLSAGNYNVTATAADGSLSASRTWNLTVTATPVSKQYISPILSLNKTQLENAVNVTINHTTLGAIDFGNNTLNLIGIVDIDSIINISRGVTAIDTEKAPELNKSASIVWKSLNFTKSPFIYFNNGFKAEGNTPCPTDVCTNITYDKTTGILSFNVAHFSTYFAAQNTTNDHPRITSTPPTAAVLNDPFSYSVGVADLDNSTFIFTLPVAPSGMSISSNGVVSWAPNTLGNYNVTVNVSDGIASDAQSFTLAVTEGARLRISDLDVRVDGKTSKNLRNSSIIRREAEPGSNVEFRIEIKNGFSSKDDMEIDDIETEVTIEGIDDGDDLEFEGDTFDLKEAKDKIVKADFDIPLAVDEDTFDVFIRVNGEDENGTAHNVEWKLQLEVDKESHKLIVGSPSLNPSAVSCNRNTRLSASVVNVGADEESDVQLSIESEPLEISQSEKDILLDSGTEDISYNKDFSIKVRDDLAAGAYPIEVRAYRDSKLEDTKTINLKIDDCIVQKKEEVKEKVVVVGPTSTLAQQNKLQMQKPAAPAQKPILKTTKPTKVPFRETGEYMALLIATAITLTIGVFVVGSLMVFSMRR